MDFKNLEIEDPRELKGTRQRPKQMINRPMTITSAEVRGSKIDGNQKCVYIQFYYDDDPETEHLMFGGFKILIGQVNQFKPEDFPITNVKLVNQSGYLLTSVE